jgi:uncharacterized damage-inducible protein DinB
MTNAALVQARIFESWQYYQTELVRVIAPLTDAQLLSRPVAGQRTLGELAEHIVRARALWLPRALGTRVPELEPLANWDEPEDPPRTAAELLQGLDLTWRHLTACLARWPAADPSDALPAEQVTQLQIVWGLYEHDLHHGGELSFVLGAAGLPVPDM